METTSFLAVVKFKSEAISNAPIDVFKETEASKPELSVLPIFVVGNEGVA
jgi:hypothetical protein